MSLIAQLNQSKHRIVDCVRLAAVWVGHLDHDYSDEEEQLILARLPDRADGVPLHTIVAGVEAAFDAEDVGELAPVFAYMRDNLSEASREPLLRLVCEIVAADGRVSVGERHGIAYLADLVGRADQLADIWQSETGLAWSDPPDLSDSVYWSRLEEQRRRQDGPSGSARDGAGQEHRGDRGIGSGPDSARVAALAVLGLVGEPSPEDIKAAYRRLARVHHPDRFHGLDAEAVEHATKAFQRIQQAYELLTR